MLLSFSTLCTSHYLLGTIYDQIYFTLSEKENEWLTVRERDCAHGFSNFLLLSLFILFKHEMQKRQRQNIVHMLRNQKYLLHLVNNLPNPQYVPPPTFVPLTRWNSPSPSTYNNAKRRHLAVTPVFYEPNNTKQERKQSTLIMLTPEPMFTSKYGNSSFWSICTNSLWPSICVKASWRIAY